MRKHKEELKALKIFVTKKQYDLLELMRYEKKLSISEQIRGLLESNLEFRFSLKEKKGRK